MKASVIICTLAVAAGTTYAIAHYGTDDKSASVATTTGTQPIRNETIDVRADVRRLEAELMALRRELSQRAPTPADAHSRVPQGVDASQEPTGLDPLARTGALADAARQFDDHTAQIAATFSNELRDPRFAIVAGEGLRTMLDNQEFASMPVQNIDCRSVTCRVEINDDGSGAVSQALPMLAVRMAETLPNIIAQRLEQPNGRATMVLFMSK
jgi:hypothetical protein